ncbi:hypothetical protein [Endozoicomonas sp. ONNA2]|uniref:hypothetical protein n=1 Tax=Endozoicomonas sp. ONNA2 TaxID=2828741 RepID=UPI002148E443|nr:hypothetical protein [Endozoicomonas sp. ONNA2]
MNIIPGTPTYQVPPPTQDAKRGYLQTLAMLPRDQAQIEAFEMVSYLQSQYLSDQSATMSLSARSVSFAARTSPIDKLMKLDQNTDLARGLNSLVKAFNKEISDFKEKINSAQEDTIIRKADGLTRIPCLLNKRSYNDYSVINCNEKLLKYFELLMKPSDYSQWFKAVHRLAENTLQCSTTDGTNNPDNNSLILFFDKLNAMTGDDQYDKDGMNYIIRELQRGKIYYDFQANTVGYFISSALTETRDVKLFRDILDSLFTLYEFTPSTPLMEINNELNNIINTKAVCSSDHDLWCF